MVAFMKNTIQHINVSAIWKLMEEVADPEIPVLSVIDLGIVRNIKLNDEEVEIYVKPTYSGCPAIDAISMNIKMTLLQNGFNKIKITQQLSPAWTTDWLTDSGKEKLKAYGITPPVGKSFDVKDLADLKVPCPLCHSLDTKIISQFGATSCKALYQCSDCKEPFDYFKCH
jgi:ring-1,2-phenylacetyl-CoA epoxidase subunit PaaD